MNKRGLELAIGTLVVIILAIVVLIFLLIFWNSQTGIFSDFFSSFVGKSNVDALVTSCNSLVTQQAVYEYCCIKKDVRYEQNGEIKKEKLTCGELAGKEFTGNRINELSCEDEGC